MTIPGTDSVFNLSNEEHRKRVEQSREKKRPDKREIQALQPSTVCNSIERRTACSTSFFFERYVPSPIAGMEPAPLGSGNVNMVKCVGGPAVALTSALASGATGDRYRPGRAITLEDKMDWYCYRLIQCYKASRLSVAP